MGVLTLLEGSTLPAEGQGTIKVFMDSRISKDSSGALAQQFLGSGEIPIYMELKFNVGVDISLGLQHFGTTAPFDKKCGMNIGAMFERSQNKLGPMLCRSTFDELHHLPHLGDALPGWVVMALTAHIPVCLQILLQARPVPSIYVHGPMFVNAQVEQ